jgi:hypothetical protein
MVMIIWLPSFYVASLRIWHQGLVIRVPGASISGRSHQVIFLCSFYELTFSQLLVELMTCVVLAGKTSFLFTVTIYCMCICVDVCSRSDSRVGKWWGWVCLSCCGEVRSSNLYSEITLCDDLCIAWHYKVVLKVIVNSELLLSCIMSFWNWALKRVSCLTR